MRNVFHTFRVPISWIELFKRTAREFVNDNCLGLAAELAYYLFLALFPALLFLLGVASFFSLQQVANEVVVGLSSVVPGDVLTIVRDQIQRISEAGHGGILTIGFLGAMWSSSAATVSIIDAMNRAYGIKEGRPWWKVRLVAIGLTIALALLVVLAFALVVGGPAIARLLNHRFQLGYDFEHAWNLIRWPVSAAMVSLALTLVYYFAPDAEQLWEWITPGSVIATVLWLAVSVGVKLYVQYFENYNAVYGTVGGVIVLMLWFYVSGLAILAGAELNAEIERASPHAKAVAAEQAPGEKKKIGRLAELVYRARHRWRRPDAAPIAK